MGSGQKSRRGRKKPGWRSFAAARQRIEHFSIFARHSRLVCRSTSTTPTRHMLRKANLFVVGMGTQKHTTRFFSFSLFFREKEARHTCMQGYAPHPELIPC